jgi:hypothetical protein
VRAAAACGTTSWAARAANANGTPISGDNTVVRLSNAIDIEFGTF